MAKKIILISTGQPSTNPRIVKEAISLSEIGYEITVIYNFWASWALEFDKSIIKTNPQINWIEVGGNPIRNKSFYYFTRFRHKIFKYFNRIFPKSLFIALRAESRCYYELLMKANTLKADLYIAHNLGALGVAANAAKFNHTKYGFDAEDFHRGQVSVNSLEYLRAKLLEDKYFPYANYITAASPLIAKHYEVLYNKKTHIINNFFSLKFLSKENTGINRPISLFWFSQTVGKGRGLEDIILALQHFTSNDFCLTILGKSDKNISDYLNNLNKSGIGNRISINFLEPVEPHEIFNVAAQHDIGLAIETNKDMNNGIALSNKIFTYLLASNAVIFSNTPAQKKFFIENNNIGQIYKSGDINSLVIVLKKYIENTDLLNLHKSNSLQIASTNMNWENESNQLVSLIKDII